MTQTPIPTSITCPRCGMTSSNTGDIEHRYCGRCNQFYDEMLEIAPTIRSPKMDRARKQVADLVRRVMPPRGKMRP